jgi:hypothetical protein
MRGLLILSYKYFSKGLLKEVRQTTTPAQRHISSLLSFPSRTQSWPLIGRAWSGTEAMSAARTRISNLPAESVLVAK